MDILIKIVNTLVYLGGIAIVAAIDYALASLLIKIFRR